MKAGRFLRLPSRTEPPCILTSEKDGTLRHFHADNSKDYRWRRRVAAWVLGLGLVVGAQGKALSEVPVAPVDWLELSDWTEETSALGEAKATRNWTMVGACGVWACFGALCWLNLQQRVRI